MKRNPENRRYHLPRLLPFSSLHAESQPGRTLGPGAAASAEQFGFQADKLTDSTANRTSVN